MTLGYTARSTNRLNVTKYDCIVHYLRCRRNNVTRQWKFIFIKPWTQAVYKGVIIFILSRNFTSIHNSSSRILFTLRFPHTQHSVYTIQRCQHLRIIFILRTILSHKTVSGDVEFFSNLIRFVWKKKNLKMCLALMMFTFADFYMKFIPTYSTS